MEIPASGKEPARRSPSFEARLCAEKLRELEHLFTYHAPTDVQVQAMKEIRAKALDLAILISIHAPNGADKSAAIRKLRETVQTANAAIVLDVAPAAVVPREKLHFGPGVAISAAEVDLITNDIQINLKKFQRYQPHDSGERSFVCGVDCQPGDSNCNGYCSGKVPAPPRGTPL